MRRVLRLQESQDVFFEGGRLVGRLEAFDQVALAVDQELGEVPFDLDAVGQGDEQRIGLRSVHVDLLEDREGRTEFELAERLDFFDRARSLAEELVAGEIEDGEAFFAVFLSLGNSNCTSIQSTY